MNIPNTPATPAPSPSRATAALDSAFRDLHGPRLHGFALVLALGDREAAAASAAAALADGGAEADRLRHPERAAAWLRARVLRRLGRRGAVSREGRRVLRGLGLDDAAIEGLAALRPIERAVLVASDVERLAPRDVEIVVDRDAAGARRLARDARLRYLVAATSADREGRPAAAAGELATRIRELAEQTVRPARHGGR